MGTGDTLKPAPLHPISSRKVGRGGGCGWLGPPLSSVLANAGAGMGDKEQSLQMKKLPYLMS
jgi:hypothetical protein